MSLYIKAYDNESAEGLLKRFKRQMKFEGRMQEIRKSDFYLTKSQKRRLKRRRRKTSDGRELM